MDINIDVSNIKFCPGPCNSIEPEPLPLNNNYYYFKPHSGNRYPFISYPYKNNTLYLNNIRICRSCNNRYNEFSDENDNEQLELDAEKIIKKLKIIEM